MRPVARSTDHIGAKTPAKSLGTRPIFRFILLPVLLLPFIEIAGFIIVGGWIGILPTLVLLVALGVAGSLLLRRQGLGLVARLRGEMDAGRAPATEVIEGGLLLLAGLFLLLPGFFTDLFALPLLLPFVRRRVAGALRKRIAVYAPGARAGRRPGVVDLDPEDFSRAPDPSSPWRGNRIEGP
jgi:UPF0716 protein FxsA